MPQGSVFFRRKYYIKLQTRPTYSPWAVDCRDALEGCICRNSPPRPRLRLSRCRRAEPHRDRPGSVRPVSPRSRHDARAMTGRKPSACSHADDAIVAPVRKQGSAYARVKCLAWRRRVILRNLLWFDRLVFSCMIEQAFNAILVFVTPGRKAVQHVVLNVMLVFSAFEPEL